MSAELTSPFARCDGQEQAVLLEFLERQSQVLGGLDRPLVWEVLQGRRDLSLVDFGCGDGSYLEALVRGAPRTMFAAVVGVDIQACWIDACRRRSWLTPADFHLGDIGDLQWGREGGVDVVVSRFTLISAKDLAGAIRSAHHMLKPGGLMIAIESSYGLAQALNTSPAMTGFSERMIAWYRRAGSSPDLGPQLWKPLAQEGFTVMRDLVLIYGNSTLGAEPMAQFTAMTARQLGSVYPDIFPAAYADALLRALRHDFSEGLLGCMATNLVVGQKNGPGPATG